MVFDSKRKLFTSKFPFRMNEASKKKNNYYYSKAMTRYNSVSSMSFDENFCHKSHSTFFCMRRTWRLERRIEHFVFVERFKRNFTSSSSFSAVWSSVKGLENFIQILLKLSRFTFQLYNLSIAIDSINEMCRTRGV